MIKRYRYRIYPTDEQKDQLNQWFGCGTSHDRDINAAKNILALA